MKTMIIQALLGALLIMTGCDTQVHTDKSIDSVHVDRVTEIAGDKTATAELMSQAFAKGTFDDALALAMQDSALAHEVLSVVKADPRLLAELSAKNAAIHPVVGAIDSRTRTSATSTRVTSQRKQGDVLDQTEQTAHKANEKLDQAARIKKQAEEARRKAEEILKR